LRLREHDHTDQAPNEQRHDDGRFSFVDDRIEREVGDGGGSLGAGRERDRFLSSRDIGEDRLRREGDGIVRGGVRVRVSHRLHHSELIAVVADHRDRAIALRWQRSKALMEVRAPSMGESQA
jgi:hypothetical protein